MRVAAFSRTTWRSLSVALLGGVLGAWLIGGAAAHTQDDVDDSVNARHGYYQLLKFNLGQLAAMAKGEVDYDAGAAQTAADNLKALSGLSISALWPEGTDNAALPGKTRALPEIWADVDGVRAKHVAFVQAAGKMADVAGQGLDALRPQVGAVGGTCKGCHDDYRAKSF